MNKGKLFIHSKETHFKNFGEATKGGIGYLSENRKLYGLALPQTVQDNVLSCVIDKYSKGILYNPAKHTALVQEKIDEMQVYPVDPRRQVNSFSGGNQQKVLMAKWLAADVDILILDESNRDVDVGAKQTIHDAIRRFVKQGKSVILLSSDLQKHQTMVFCGRFSLPPCAICPLRGGTHSTPDTYVASGGGLP